MFKHFHTFYRWSVIVKHILLHRQISLLACPVTFWNANKRDVPWWMCNKLPSKYCCKTWTIIASKQLKAVSCTDIIKKLLFNIRTIILVTVGIFFKSPKDTTCQERNSAFPVLSLLENSVCFHSPTVFMFLFHDSEHSAFP